MLELIKETIKYPLSRRGTGNMSIRDTKEIMKHIIFNRWHLNMPTDFFTLYQNYMSLAIQNQIHITPALSFLTTLHLAN